MASEPATLRARLRAREPMIGAFVTAPSAELVEVAAYTGFDFAVIDAEHGSIDSGAVLNMVRAAQSASLPAIVRVPRASKEFVLRGLDAGAAGIVVPQVDNAVDARVAIAETRYPPNGTRGAAYYARVHRYSARSGFDALDAVDDDVAAGVQIESPAAMERLDEILDVSGIDFVLAGPADLSVGYGRGSDNEERVNRAMQQLAIACASRRLASIIGAPNPPAAKRYAALGFTTIVTGLLPLLMRAGEAFVRDVRAIQNSGAIA